VARSAGCTVVQRPSGFSMASLKACPSMEGGLCLGLSSSTCTPDTNNQSLCSKINQLEKLTINIMTNVRILQRAVKMMAEGI
jgi:hypothetical protein